MTPTKHVGVFLYDQVEPLDFVGAYQVFGSVSRIRPGSVALFTFALRRDPVTCTNGLIVTPECTFDDISQIDVLIIPGGEGRRVPMANPMIISNLERLFEKCEFIMGVSTGALILAAARLLRGRQATTHWLAMKELQQRDDLIPYSGKIVRAGRLLTCAGGSLGIDTALYIVKEMYGQHLAHEVRVLMEHHHPEVPVAVF